MAAYNDATRADLAICHHRSDDDTNSVAELSDFVPFDSTAQARKQIAALNRDWDSHLQSFLPRGGGYRRNWFALELMEYDPEGRDVVPEHVVYYFRFLQTHPTIYRAARPFCRRGPFSTPAIPSHNVALTDLRDTKPQSYRMSPKACQKGEDGMTAVANPVERWIFDAARQLHHTQMSSGEV